SPAWVSRERSASRPTSAPGTRSAGHRGGVGPDDHGVGDRDDLVDGEVRRGGVAADRLGAVGLVDAERAELAALLREDVAADPADAGAVLVAFLGRACGGRLEIRARRPAVATQEARELDSV